ncbi:DUF3592 domain-containing protein [Streptomyces sp. NPDC004065]|uniref:DUF3592 domain-containing protein n=1 Tax=Streptomyces sp. NPDC004065 TaxID=3364689 RepID=UPI00384BD8D5
MDQPWPAVLLALAVLWTAIGAHGTRAALRARRSLRRLGVPGVRTTGEVANSARRIGPSYHPPQIRYQAPPMGHPHTPTDSPHHPYPTYRQVPLNPDAPNALHRGTPVVLRYDPADPRRIVVVRTTKAYSPTANLIWCTSFTACGLALALTLCTLL